MKQNKTLWIVGIIIVLGLMIFQTGIFQKEKEGVFIECYDSEGNLLSTIQMPKTMDLMATIEYETEDIIQLDPDTATIKLIVIAENTGTAPLTTSYISGVLTDI